MVSPGDGALGRYEFVAACEAPGPLGPGPWVDGCYDSDATFQNFACMIFCICIYIYIYTYTYTLARQVASKIGDALGNFSGYIP